MSTETKQAPIISAALYYDVATWEQIRREVPYPFKRKYAIGQSFVDEGKTWVVISAWVERGVYRVLCSRSIPAWLTEELTNANHSGSDCWKPPPD